jgi:PAS domain S-box-containing protein
LAGAGEFAVDGGCYSLLSKLQLYNDPILIVDDMPLQAGLLERVLEGAGYDNLTIENNPLRALERFKQEAFELILLDYAMPEMSGIELMEQMVLHQQSKADDGVAIQYLPIVILTADHEKKVRLNAFNAGARDFITKPFNQQEVVSRVSNLLEVQRAGSQLREQAKSLDRMYGELSAMHEEVREERDFVESILKSIQEGIVVIDSAGKIIRSNQKMAEMVGGESVSSLLGRSVAELFVDGRGGAVFVQQILLSSSVECKLQNRTGKVVPVQVSGAPLGQTEKGVVDGGVLVVYDLSERKSLERAAQEAAYQGGMAEISSNVLHNFGNGMTAIKFYLEDLQVMKSFSQRLEQLLRSREEDGEGGAAEQVHSNEELADAVADAHERFFDEPLSLVMRTTDRISDLLIAQKGVSGDGGQFWVSRFDLSKALSEALLLVKEQAEQSGVSLKVEVDATLEEVSLPRNLFQQMVVNLLQNAVEATNARYCKLLDQQGKEEAYKFEGVVELSVTVLKGGRGIFQLQCKDNGIGFDSGVAEDLNEIFSPHYTTKPSSGGYGLHSAGNFAYAAKGEIFAEHGESGEGACLRVLLPIELEEGVG